MRSFSIPYNNDQLLLDRLFEEFPRSANSCKEIFFAVPATFMGTGRALNQGGQYEQEVMDLIKKAHQYGIESNLLLNSGCTGLKITDSSFTDGIVKYVYNLKETAGLDVVTAADYLLAGTIKKFIPEIKLECSSIAYVDSLEKAKYWEDLGCDIMVIPPVMNKNMRFIEQLHKNLPNIQLKLVVNQECLHGCPMWHGHHNLRGHGDEGEVYLKVCKNLFEEKPWGYYSSSYIPPKYLDDYDKYIGIYKLVDRKLPTDIILQSFGIYCGEEKYRNKINECNERIPEKVFKKVIYCDKNCSECNFCECTYRTLRERE